MLKNVTYKEIWGISWPIMIGSAIENIINLTDTVFLGRLNEVALGAGAIGGIFYLSLIMIGFGFSIGTQILVARRYGEQKPLEIGETLWHSAIFMIITSVLLVALVSIFSNSFFNVTIQQDSVKEAVKTFTTIRIWGLPFAFISMLYRSFFIGILRTKVIGVITFITAITNIILGYGLVFGNLGLPPLGIKGAAISSVCAEIIGSLAFISYTYYFTNHRKYNLYKFHSFNWAILLNNIKVAGPVMMQFFIAFGGWFIFFIFVEKMGQLPLAASNILRTVYSAINLPLWGFASAVNSLVSSHMGANKTHEVFLIIRKSIYLSLLSVLVILGLVWMFKQSIFSFFTPNLQMVDICIQALPVLSIGAILLAISVILYNGVSGSGNTLVSFLIECSIIISYCALSYLILISGKASVWLIWTVEIHYPLVMGVLSFLYLRFGKWRNKNI